ncbi:MAG: preprotein translocase subunit YajC [Gemmatimonadaceae bacterium]|nr:preprotein translocase subunit YajC [Gemmatimonadaceae bacterium]MBX9857240.1 preprotein translocase subunit YajC [Gemmatimonadaceae bacterium]
MTGSIIASFALLQAPAGSAVPQMIFMYGAIFAIFYFVLIRPQQKQRKQHEERVKSLKKGDEIVTAGGIVGEVVHIAGTGNDGAAKLTDRITIKSGESKLIVERGRIAAVGGGSATPNA